MDAIIGCLGTPVPLARLRALGEVHEATRRDLEASTADVWVLEADQASEAVVKAMVDAQAAVLVVGVAAPDRRAALLAQGLDAVGTDASEDEVVARVRGLLARRTWWSPTAGRVCRTAVHDLRGPLQGLRFTLAAMQGLEVDEDTAEDLAMLGDVADTLEVMLHGIYNLGRSLGEDTRGVLDVAEVLGELEARPFFRERLDLAVDGPLRARGGAADLKVALLDVLRVAVQLAPSHRQIRVVGMMGARDVRVVVDVPVYRGLADHAGALVQRAAPVWMRGTVRLPVAGLAFARDAVEAAQGRLEVEPVEEGLVRVTLLVPRA